MTKKYTAIITKSETIQIDGENIHDAILKSKEEAKKKGFEFSEIVITGEGVKYKVKIELI